VNLVEYQIGNLLNMVARGTPGGSRRADGSEIERGVHLRWQVAPELGFPSGGFDIYRRVENNGHYWRCGAFRQADVVGAAWLPHDDDHLRPGVTLKFPGKVVIAAGCRPGATNAASFPGEREVRLNFEQPVRVVRIVFHGNTAGNPTAEAYSLSSEGPVLLARQRARKRGGQRILTLHANPTDYVVLRGTDMVLCELCFVLLREGRDRFWPDTPLNGNTPIYLPITHPVWDSPHRHTPDDQAEARSRLPAGLLQETRTAYVAGFRDDLHAILYDLVGTDPQRLYRLRNADQRSAATLDWPGMNLVQLLALDPNLARVLGLYWHDEPPSADAYFDYRVIAHYGDASYPGLGIDFARLEPGRRFGPTLEHAGLTFVSPNPVEVSSAIWAGSQHSGLHFGRELAAAPIAITLPERTGPPRSVTLHLVTEAAISASAYLGPTRMASLIKTAGEVTMLFEHPSGIDTILLFPLGDVDLVSIVMRENIDPLGDVVYDAFHVRTNTPAPASRPSLGPPQVVEAGTGISEKGRLMTGQSRVDLRWKRGEAGGNHLLADEPIFYLVQRGDLADDGETVLAKSVLNEAAPTLVSERPHSDAGPAMYSDRSVPDGTYWYSVRGIDLFGVLGDWGPSQEIVVHDRQPPPPPQGVKASYLDPADPSLSQEDRDWALANGPGVRLTWQWPGLFSMQAPDVAEPLGEFRAYTTKGVLNRLDGTALSVTAHGATSTVSTDIKWPGAANELVGLSLRIGQSFFTIGGNTSGDNCVFTVDNLSVPDLAPAPGPCSLTICSDHSAWRDYGRASNWRRRLTVAPVRDARQITARVATVTNFDAASADIPVIARPGATRTVTLDRGLQDVEGSLLPGVLLCEGVAYHAYGHTIGRALRIHLVPTAAPAEISTLIEPPVGAGCTYYPGRRYELRVEAPSLPLANGQATAVAHVAMSCSDGQPETLDDPIWSRPGRGGLGGRSGNESALSAPARIEAVRRTPPPAVAHIPTAPIEPIYAAPANYYGQARYTLTWESVSEASGYAVYRCNGPALFDQDRTLRQTRKGPYTTGSVFADDPGFAPWLNEFDPALTEAEMLADVDRHVDAWRAWGGRFYAELTDAHVQIMAGSPGTEGVFRRVTPDLVLGTAFTDTFEGRGRGFYIYRVRTVDAAGNLSPWHEAVAFPPVHIFDVTPPTTPSITSVLGGERSIIVAWRANPEPDLTEYRLWWGENPEQLADVRRTPPSAVASPTGAVYESHEITGLAGGTTLYVRVAAIDPNGNVSAPSAAAAGRAIDTTSPIPPTWVSADRNPEGLVVDLRWQLGDPGHATLVQRAPTGGSVWTPVSPWLVPGTQTFVDERAQSSNGYGYRLLARSDSGLISDPSSIATVAAVSFAGGQR